MHVKYYLPLPKSVKGEERLRRDGTWHDIRPDLDNLTKYLGDALEGVVWKNDAQICDSCCSKVWTKQSEGCIYLTVMPIQSACIETEEDKEPVTLPEFLF